MRHSLRLRVLGMMVAVLAVALGTLALFASQATMVEFHRFVSADAAERDARLRETLDGFYKQEGSWTGVQPVVEQMGRVAGARIVLTSKTGDVVADSIGAAAAGMPITSAHQMFEHHIEIQRIAQAPSGTLSVRLAPGLLHGGAVAFMDHAVPAVPALPAPAAGFAEGQPRLVRLPAPASDTFMVFAPGPPSDFLSSVNRSVWWAALLAGLAAVVLSLALSRRILRPVEALTVAARRMETGDLSTRVEVGSQDEIGQLAHAFNAMAEGLEQQERLRRTLASDISHELRTPLANIRGYLEALQEGVVAPSPGVLGSLHEEAMLLNRLVDDLQDLSLAEAGQLRLETRPVLLAPLVEAAITALTPRAAEKGIALRAALPDDLPPALADPERIGQVLRNLLANALTHTPAGGTVTTTARAAEDRSFLEVTVADSGSGIPAEHLPHVFDRFYRADPSRTRATGGAGLGLAIVRQLVVAHGGEVGAESEPGSGARFRFTLPVAGAGDGSDVVGGSGL
jgi:signal transduction histidine kinase